MGHNASNSKFELNRLYIHLTRSTTVRRSRFLFHLFSLCTAVVQA